MRESEDSDRFDAATQAGARTFGAPAWAWSLLALLFGLALTAWAAGAQYREARREQARILVEAAEHGFRALEQQLHACEWLLRAVQTVFLASEKVTAGEFEHLVRNLQPRNRFPGLQAIAFAELERRADGVHYLIRLVAPAEPNAVLVGLDVRTQPENFAAVLRARDSDEPSLSAPFRLVQQRPDEPPDGVTLRLPVFTPGPPPRDVAERRRRERGSLAVSFRLQPLIGSALADGDGELRIVVEDTQAGVRLYDSNPHAEVRGATPLWSRELAYGGRVWRMRAWPVAARAATAMPWLLLLAGTLASGLLALLVWSVATTRLRALQLAEGMSRRYRSSEERFRALNELLPALVLMADGEGGQVVYANQAARNRLGEGVQGASLPDLFEDPVLRGHVGSVERAAFANTETVLRSVNGDRFWANVSISDIALDGRAMLLMVAADVSEQRQLSELLSYQATHDALTGLFNRREFERRVAQALAALQAGGQPAALLYLDLDQFKLINDTSGHVAGDQLLAQLANLFREQLRVGDVLARLGGDEFGVLAMHADEPVARRLAERLRECIDGYVFAWEQRTYPISASIGVVLLDHPGSLQEMFARADTACYLAKEGGRNRVHMYSEQDDESRRRRDEMEWVNRLRWALQEGRLLLDYQELVPLHPAADSAGPHIELLLRMRDEQGQVVMPGAFIAAAERYGLAPALDRWVIDTALANFAALHRSGAPVRMCAINLSATTIEDETLVPHVLEQIRAHAVPPQALCFEITETAAVRNLAQVGRFIGQLREVGCRIALDDFGAGMSSFAYLKNLPVDMIKIDGSFIRDLMSDPMSQAIVGAITEIGHQRGLAVIAEWVTDDAQREALRGMGVDYAQGFGVHEPERVAFQRG
ncbi:bifunctional diguanylate cyclase/phosphodiesterase [Vulcaniibacterium gelatinicum]|uniref:bifunctional diguanylate cyclase/phosphodiesterase n=1 Tax=Vulcaniibacterium gelatinicum TaxID=2598725 RepID=UPI001FE286F1|nr:EAL domain-containing protein [Vulcaniibacterium gelatinicum]